MFPQTIVIKVLFVPVAVFGKDDVAFAVPNLYKFVNCDVREVQIPIQIVNVDNGAQPVAENIMVCEENVPSVNTITETVKVAQKVQPVERWIRRKIHVPYGKFIARQHGRPIVFKGPHTVERVYCVK